MNADGTPNIQMALAGTTWEAIIDTGFNGFLELPSILRPVLNAQYLFDAVSALAGGQSVVEQFFEVLIPFDGVDVVAEVTFVSGSQLLLGTALLKNHRLYIDFKARKVLIEWAP